MAADGVICDGDHLVLDVNGEKLSFVQKLKANGTIRVGKYTVSTAPLIGAPFGALFEVTADGKSLQRVLLPPADEITRITDTERDNSNLFDRNTENQKLTQEQIEELKKSGKAGSEIVDLLCSNSATFEKKTEFAQDKYKRRKAKKYITYLTPRKPTARMISEAYYDKCPERVWNLRHDTLAVMLSLGNVAAGAKVLVVEHCLGLVTAAAVERLGGQGAVCATQLDERAAPLDAVRLMNLDPQQRSVLFTAYASSLLKDKAAVERCEGLAAMTTAVPAAAPATIAAAAITGASEAAGEQAAQADDGKQQAEEAAGAGGEEAKSADAAEEAMEVDAATAASGSAAGPDAGAGAGPSAGGQQQERQPRGGGGRDGGGGGYGSFMPRPEALLSVLSSGFDCCLLAHPKMHPTALLDAIWPLLAPSATFAVYSPWAQPLAEALAHLQGSRNAVMLQLQESWLRPHQVLPARTHPHMTCSGSGGYLLSGIKVVPPEATPLAAALVQHLKSASGGAATGGSGAGPAVEAKAEPEAAGGEGEGQGDGEGRGRWQGRGGRGGRGGRDGGGRGGRGGRWNNDGGRGGRGGGRDNRGKRKADGGSGDSPGAKRSAQ